MTPTTLSRILLLCAFFITPLYVHAQTLQSGFAPSLPSASAASYYYIAKPGELTMPVRPDCRPGGQVNIPARPTAGWWGFVQKPGRYEVPSSTDLIQLISFAGGPVQYAKLDNAREALSRGDVKGASRPGRVHMLCTPAGLRSGNSLIS